MFGRYFRLSLSIACTLHFSSWASINLQADIPQTSRPYHTPHINHLFVPDILIDVFQRLDASSWLNTRRVCRQWQRVADHPQFWHAHKTKYLKWIGHPNDSNQIHLNLITARIRPAFTDLGPVSENARMIKMSMDGFKIAVLTDTQDTLITLSQFQRQSQNFKFMHQYASRCWDEKGQLIVLNHNTVHHRHIIENGNIPGDYLNTRIGGYDYLRDYDFKTVQAGYDLDLANRIYGGYEYKNRSDTHDHILIARRGQEFITERINHPSLYQEYLEFDSIFAHQFFNHHFVTVDRLKRENWINSLTVSFDKDVTLPVQPHTDLHHIPHILRDVVKLQDLIPVIVDTAIFRTHYMPGVILNVQSNYNLDKVSFHDSKDRLPKPLMDLLQRAFLVHNGTDQALEGWSSLNVLHDMTEDGVGFVGTGTFQGQPRLFHAFLPFQIDIPNMKKRKVSEIDDNQN